MINKAMNNSTVLGLDLFYGADSFVKDMTEEDESLISGGRRFGISDTSISNKSKSRRRKRRRRNRSRSRT